MIYIKGLLFVAVGLAFWISLLEAFPLGVVFFGLMGIVVYKLWND